MVLDGEVVALDADGRPSFSALHKRVALKAEREIAAADATTPAIFFCFDLLHFAGIGLREAPFSARSRYLAQCLFPSPHVQLVHAQADGDRLYDAALANGFEGVMAKKRASLYTPGRRSASWRKIKSTQSAEFIVGGYTRGKGARASLGALMLGVNETRVKGKLRYVGHVGTGFDASTLTAVRRRAAPLETAKSPFATRPAANGAPTWLEPRLVAEVRFAEWTPDGHLRAPVFLRFRDDVDPKAVTGRAVRRATRANPPSEAQSDVDAVLRQLDEPHTLQLVSVPRASSSPRPGVLAGARRQAAGTRVTCCAI
jgi:bifunctional non-homologous end joining protein LigD